MKTTTPTNGVIQMKNQKQETGNNCNGTIVVYDGHTLFDTEFGLYGYEDIDFQKSKDAILEAFESEYLDEIKKTVNTYGLEFVKLEYFSPREYNFETDSIDLSIVIADRDMLRTAIYDNRNKINTALTDNKSYDGYMATTVQDVKTELEDLDSNPNYDPDILVLKTLFAFDFDFDVMDYLVSEYDEDENDE